ncbi:MAG: hypothetical protein NT153_08105 [Bacteroidetes bacterium]|nr:hypothetical protein [Bacteroidota bacterium]
MAQNALVWHKIAEHINLINWQPNQLALFEVAGKTITLIQLHMPALKWQMDT